MRWVYIPTDENLHSFTLQHSPGGEGSDCVWGWIMLCYFRCMKQPDRPMPTTLSPVSPRVTTQSWGEGEWLCLEVNYIMLFQVYEAARQANATTLSPVSLRVTTLSWGRGEWLCLGVNYIMLFEVYEAARQANAHNFISSFPQGYNTVLGERGVTVSGGELYHVIPGVWSSQTGQRPQLYHQFPPGVQYSPGGEGSDCVWRWIISCYFRCMIMTVSGGELYYVISGVWSSQTGQCPQLYLQFPPGIQHSPRGEGVTVSGGELYHVIPGVWSSQTGQRPQLYLQFPPGIQHSPGGEGSDCVRGSETEDSYSKGSY